MIRPIASLCGFAVLAVIAFPSHAAESIDADWLQPEPTALQTETIPELERSLALVRSQYGVFDLRQLDILKQLAASLTAVGRYTDAQEYMLYAVRAAEKTYGEGDLQVVPAFCDLGDWFADVRGFRESRMAYQAALNIVATKAGDENLAAVIPLRRAAASFMRELSFPEAFPDLGVPPAFRSVNAPPWEKQNEQRQLIARTEAALLEAVRILDAHADASPQMLIDTLVQTGDWFQIRKAPDKALPYYQRAWRLIAAEPARAASPLDFPVRVYYPTPLIARNNPAANEPHYVQLEFDVGADGSVSKSRIVQHDTLDRYAENILEAMRRARFRPKLTDGKPVATHAVSYRQVLRTNSSPRAEPADR